MIPYRHIIWRILWIIPTMICSLAFVFIIVRLLPHDPVAMIVPPDKQTPEIIATMTKAMGLDRPLHEQFFTYLANIFRGDLGYSWHTRRHVSEELSRRLPATFELLIFSTALVIIIAIPLGILGGWKKGKLVDGFISIITLSGIVVPSFWYGLLLIFFFYYLIPIFPTPIGRLSYGVIITRITGLHTLDSLLTGNINGFLDSLRHLFLPVITLSFGSIAYITRIQRVEIIEALESDYIKTARAKGASERDILFKHALKNALLPTVTDLGMRFGFMLGGSIIIEHLFCWPGMGGFAADCIRSLDYSGLQGFVVFIVVMFSISNLVVDILYSFIDPRIRHG